MARKGSSRTEHIRELRNAKQVFAERHLFGRDQIDLERAAQPRAEVVREIAREDVIQQADGPHLLIADLPGAGEAVWLQIRAALAFGIALAGAGRLKECINLILPEGLFHG